MTDPRFDPAQVFAVFGMRHVDTAGFDAAVVQAPGSDLRCVFLWGQDCYNCNLFKQAALLHQETLLGLGLSWFEADAVSYTHLDVYKRQSSCLRRASSSLRRLSAFSSAVALGVFSW